MISEHAKSDMANFSTSNGSKRTFEELVCSSDVDEVHAMRFVIAIQIALSLTTSLGNTLMLFALNKESSLHPPSKVLYTCLASSDLCVGLILQPLYVVILIAAMQGYTRLCTNVLMVTYLVGIVIFGISLSTLTAISIDRLFALLLRLKYRLVVTLNRCRILVAFLWFFHIFVATMYFWVHLIFLWYGYILMLVCLITSLSAYTKIFFVLRNHRISIQNGFLPGRLPNGTRSRATPCNMMRYRRTVCTAIWVQLTLVACYLPYGVYTTLVTIYGLSPSLNLASRFVAILVYLHSTLNPFLYYWKITEVRRVVKDTLRWACLASQVQDLPTNARTTGI